MTKTTRPLRADAQRNRDAILAAARETFETDGVLASLAEADELARTLTPRAALAEWLVRLTWQLRIWHDLPYCLAAAHNDAESPMTETSDPLVERTGAFLEAAGVPGDVSAGEVYELVLALSWGVDRFGDDEQAARRRVTMATVGLFA
jgi:hypothetical protein